MKHRWEFRFLLPYLSTICFCHCGQVICEQKWKVFIVPKSHSLSLAQGFYGNAKDLMNFVIPWPETIGARLMFSYQDIFWYIWFFSSSFVDDALISALMPSLHLYSDLLSSGLHYSWRDPWVHLICYFFFCWSQTLHLSEWRWYFELLWNRLRVSSNWNRIYYVSHMNLFSIA